MKYFSYTFITLAFTALFLFSACESGNYSSEADLSSKADSVSYSIGFLQGSGMAQEGLTDIEMKNFVAGFQQALAEEDPEMEMAAMQQTIQSYMMEIQQRQEMERSEQAEGVRAEGQEFLDENAEKEDVMVTESGLQYRVIEEGSGERPSAEDEVEVHYRGTLISGEEFDSSYSREQTITFPLNGVIPGWTEGLQLMREGATYEFFIPSELAYGTNPPPGSIILPGSVLIFEVELIDIKE
ncbi:FKBP-type peptidyl-prolyl cis-trans isomerase [Rhodohalobacter barkolensis]|uniref:Peptidyl-prolyl cis-trans isomerase n=1 Tax=Rhodohalobacter barkolensis TaxID=2053187 RepID=A0A2N0VJR1_9BACT|nr:FKBP-type peptidyl-prolyl cis-trans isomerase [Rhodohalobacter barkolensis]PKD44420.1 peptidylprolyl isomerase [Rhodohalobacter barkolensis]